MSNRDEMAEALASALPLLAGMTRETAAYITANNLTEQGYELVRVVSCSKCAAAGGVISAHEVGDHG